MRKDFWKYHGAGNDFIVINNYNPTLAHSPELARKLCDRHFGIGSDGLIILEASKEADFKMVFYNPDGSQSFCGNGSRCAVKYAFDEGIITQNKTTFISTDGPHDAEIVNEWVNLQMNHAVFLPLTNTDFSLSVSHSIFINTGSPHLILFLDDSISITDLDVKQHGARIRYSDEFKIGGVNVNFINIRGENEIDIRTYERGVEDETLSCGTGVTASAIAYHSLFNKKEGKHSVQVNSVGGKLEAKFDFLGGDYSDILLCGPAEPVFMGIINIK